MATEVIANPPAAQSAESKSARKKKAKAEAAAAIPIPTEQPASELGANSSDVAGKSNGAESENSYIKELQKSVRNVNKKLNAITKVEEIISAYPNVSLDELVSTRKINSDQKAQVQKKSSLQTQLAQLEEQLTHYKKFEQEYQTKAAQEKEILQKAHSEELEKLRSVLKDEAALEQKQAFRDRLLTLSRFLRAAAARRQSEDEESDLAKAFEGALLLVYGGDPIAVAAAEKLIDGTDEQVPSTEGVILNVTYAQIKETALAEAAPFSTTQEWADNVAESQPAPPESEPTDAPSTDPTVANAGLTEINEAAALNEKVESGDAPNVPAATIVDAGAANLAGGDWDKPPSGSDDPMTESFEIVPRDPAETETPAAPAAVNTTQSWADDTPDVALAASTATGNNDGFHEVQHNRGRGRGGHQGEGRGGYRGRGGQRGDFRGRGRGRGRGDGHRGGPRGGFRGNRGESQ